jgi:CheY-like chemotaxis protein
MGARILIVEDDALNAKFFTFSLCRRGGHQVEVCEDPERVLDLARRGEVDLIIMDVSLSNSRYRGKPVDGSSICRLLKADPRARAVPVLLATAHAMAGEREALLRDSGADDYLSKPISDPALLLSKVDALLAAAAAPVR